MRAREFLLKEAEPTLADALRAAAAQQQAAQQPKIGQPTNPNAVKQGVGAQAAQGSASPTQVTPGGTQAAAKKPMGIGQSFISGLTKGKADSLGGMAGMAKQGIKNMAANQLGMQNTVSAMGKQADAPLQKPEDLGMALKPGQTIDLPNVGKIKVTKSGPQGIELDTSQATSIGVPKLTLNPKDLLQK
jgi:hypothetical protein